MALSLSITQNIEVDRFSNFAILKKYRKYEVFKSSVQNRVEFQKSGVLISIAAIASMIFSNSILLNPFFSSCFLITGLGLLSLTVISTIREIFFRNFEK